MAVVQLTSNVIVALVLAGGCRIDFDPIAEDACAVLRPTGPGPFSDWTAVPATGEHFKWVREFSPDDDDTYLASIVDGNRDEFVHLPTGLPPATTIDSVTIRIRARSETITTNLDVAPAMTLEGASRHDDALPTTEFEEYSRSFFTDPREQPWTVASVDAMTFGVRKSYTFATVRVTQVWATVECH